MDVHYRGLSQYSRMTFSKKSTIKSVIKHKAQTLFGEKVDGIGKMLITVDQDVVIVNKDEITPGHYVVFPIVHYP